MIICDIDNVLAEDSWRLPLIRWNEECVTRRYHDYHAACLSDEPRNLDLLLPGETVVLLTAQPRSYRHLRRDWLVRHNVRHDLVVHRPDGCTLPSATLKRWMVQMVRWWALRTPAGREPITAAYDDRPEVVAAYLELGLPAQLVAIHDIDWDGMKRSAAT